MYKTIAVRPWKMVEGERNCLKIDRVLTQEGAIVILQQWMVNMGLKAQ